MRRRLLEVGLIAWALSGCETPCGGSEPTEVSAAPVIESFELLRQLEGDPWTLIFALGFSDADGDAGAGRIDLFVGDNTTPTKINAAERFSESGVPLDSQQGRIAVTPRFSERNIEDGQEVRLGAQIVDGQDNRSNCFTLTMDFAVSPTGESL